MKRHETVPFQFRDLAFGSRFTFSWTFARRTNRTCDRPDATADGIADSDRVRVVIDVDRLQIRVHVERLRARFTPAVAGLTQTAERQMRLAAVGPAVDDRDAGLDPVRGTSSRG